jgi:hypothetical protein
MAGIETIGLAFILMLNNLLLTTPAMTLQVAITPLARQQPMNLFTSCISQVPVPGTLYDISYCITEEGTIRV